jgi:hypothetical protein
MPRKPVLIWSKGTCMVGCLVDGREGDDLAFMDPKSDALLPWPSHWMELPTPPVGGDTPGHRS